MDLLPLGTVIQLNDQKAFILGYSSVDAGQKHIAGYLIASYPLGFTSIDKVIFIPHDQQFSVVAEGYRTDASEKLLKVLSESLDKVADVSSEELAKLNRILKQGAQSAKEEGEA